jgi:hypothetical protein
LRLCQTFQPNAYICLHWKRNAILQCVGQYVLSLLADAQEEECELVLLLCPIRCPFWLFPSVSVVLQALYLSFPSLCYRCLLVELCRPTADSSVKLVVQHFHIGTSTYQISDRISTDYLISVQTAYQDIKYVTVASFHILANLTYAVTVPFDAT